MSKPGSTPTMPAALAAEIDRTAEANRASILWSDTEAETLAAQIRADAALLRLASLARRELPELPVEAAEHIDHAADEIRDRMSTRLGLLRRWATAGVVSVGVVAASATAASAVAVPTIPAVRLVVAGPTTRVSITALSTANETRLGGHGLAVSVAGTTLYGCARVFSSTPQLVTVTGTVRSAALLPGAGSILVTDIGDGGNVTVPVTVLRQSSVTATATAIPGGVLVEGTAKHYDPRVGAYVGDQASPVQVQALEAGRWVTEQTVTTQPDGSVLAVANLPVGPEVVRLVRPQGATVTGAVSPVRAVEVTAPDVPADY